jgi:hypothetical protein
MEGKMKNVIYIFIFIVLSMNIFAQNPIAPNGKEVIATTYPDLTQPQIDYINNMIDSIYSFVETIQSPQPYFGTFDCHFFAWHNNQGYTIWSGPGNIWQKGTPTEYKWFDNPADYWCDWNYSIPSGYASYIQTTDSDAPIVVYKLNGVITHSARRLSGSSKLISKWSDWGVYKHAPTEVPLGYGSIAEKYKINPNYRPVGSGDPGGRNWATINNAFIGIPSGSAVTVLSGNQTLNGNINVPSGVTLTIKSGSNVNLNTFAIVSSGGTIIKEASATISGLRATLTRNSVFKGYYGRIQGAVDTVTRSHLKNPFVEG